MSARLAYLALPALLLSGCFLQDTASYPLDGRDHAITVKRTQRWPWDSTLVVEVIVRRQSECTAGGSFEDVTHDAKLLVYRAAEDQHLLVKTGKRYFNVDTYNCRVDRMKEAPEERGDKLGTFMEKDDTFQFVPAPPRAPGTDEGAAP